MGGWIGHISIDGQRQNEARHPGRKTVQAAGAVTQAGMTVFRISKEEAPIQQGIPEEGQ